MIDILWTEKCLYIYVFYDYVWVDECPCPDCMWILVVLNAVFLYSQFKINIIYILFVWDYSFEGLIYISLLIRNIWSVISHRIKYQIGLE